MGGTGFVGGFRCVVSGLSRGVDMLVREFRRFMAVLRTAVSARCSQVRRSGLIFMWYL